MERRLRVTITAAAGGTTIHVEEDITDVSRQLAGSFVGLISGALLGIGFATGLAAVELGPLIVAAFGAAGAYVFPRSDFVNKANRCEKELQELGDRLVALTEKSGVGGE
jgi:hypothetical protein